MGQFLYLPGDRLVQAAADACGGNPDCAFPRPDAHPDSRNSHSS